MDIDEASGADPDYRTRPSNEQILAAIDALALSPAE